MLDPAQKPAEPLPSEPPSEAVTVTVGGLDIAALLQGWTPRGRLNVNTASTSKGNAPLSNPATLEQNIARQKKEADEKAEQERKSRADRQKKGPPTQGVVSSFSPSQPGSSSGKSRK